MMWVVLLWAVCEGTAVAPVVVPPRIPDPTVHAVPSLCPSDKRVTRCRLLLNTNGQHVASLGAFFKLSGGDGRFVHHEAGDFHREGRVEESCQTFVHGDSRPLAEEISRVRYRSKDTAVEASWFFVLRHDDAKDALVMQIAFYGGRGVSVAGSVWMYSTSLLGYESKITCDSLSDVSEVPPGKNFAPDPPVLTADDVARLRQAQDFEIEQRKLAHARAFQDHTWARRSTEETAAKQRHDKLLEEHRKRRAEDEEAGEARKVKGEAKDKAREAAEKPAEKTAEKTAEKKASPEPKKHAPKKVEPEEQEAEDEQLEEREEGAPRQEGLWHELAAVLWVLLWVAGALLGLVATCAGVRHFARDNKKRF